MLAECRAKAEEELQNFRAKADEELRKFKAKAADDLAKSERREARTKQACEEFTSQHAKLDKDHKAALSRYRDPQALS